MTLRTDIKEVNRLSKDAADEIRLDYGGPWDADDNFYNAAIKLFKEHGDSIEQLIDMALTVNNKQGREL